MNKKLEHLQWTQTNISQKSKRKTVLKLKGPTMLTNNFKLQGARVIFNLLFVVSIFFSKKKFRNCFLDFSIKQYKQLCRELF